MHATAFTGALRLCLSHQRLPMSCRTRMVKLLPVPAGPVNRMCGAGGCLGSCSRCC